MKKSLIFISVILMFSFLSALTHSELESMANSFDLELTSQRIINSNLTESVSTLNKSVHYSFSLDSKTMPSIKQMLSEDDLPALSKTFAIPAQSADITVNSMIIDTYSLEGSLLRSSNSIESEKIFINNEFIFKEMRGFSVFVDLVSKNQNEVKVIREASFSVNGHGHYDIPQEISEAFVASYRALAHNYDSSYLYDLNYKRPSMIIVSHESLSGNSSVINFVNWKKAAGFEVHVIYKDAAGTNPSNEQIKQLIVNKYNSLENKPDYLLLLGSSRTGAIYRIPAFTYQAPNPNVFDATDLPYALIEGDDFFPEMHVGRFSFNLNNDLSTLTWKTMYYERGNFTNDNNWMKRGLVIAANYATGGLQPTTPILMSKWIADKMLTYNYTHVDTLFHPQASTTDITAKLNQGAQMITYRGWGAANGWHYPQFYNQQLQQINNSGRLGMVYSIVCATADYNHPTTNPSFAETFMNLGSEGSPNGAVAFVGPTYLYTSTEYNNSIGSGMIWGVFDEDIRIFGASVMRGRIELYNNYPRQQEVGGVANFYWGTYNVLSDPSLNMWIGDPAYISVGFPEEVAQYENSIVINATNINHGFATATRNGTDFTYVKLVDGYGILPLPNTDEGNNYRVTITSRNHRPVIRTIPINQNTGVGLVNYQVVSGNFHAGSSAIIQVTLKNFSNETIDNIEAVLSTPYDNLTINNPNASVSSIAAGQTANVEFTVSPADHFPNNFPTIFHLNISPTNQIAKFSLISGGHVFEIASAVPQNANQNLGAGQSGVVRLSIKNLATISAEGVVGQINPLTDAVNIPQNNFTLPTTPAGEISTVDFTLNVEENVFVGRNAPFEIIFSKNEVPLARAYFSLTLGVVDNTAPTGPDAYGYYAYDSFDVGYPGLAPVYDWVEIDPELGGQGTVVAIGDDTSFVVDLPFNFRYYGNWHNQLTICDNGWVAFGAVENVDFRNWNIPAALGPYNMVAVFFDDLKGQRIPDTGGFLDMLIKYWYDETNNRFIVQWSDVYFSSDATQEHGSIKFQLILYPKADDDGDLVFQYNRILNVSQNSNFATVGIENPTQSDGLCYTYSNFYPDSATPLQNGLAIRFTTTPPDNFVSVNDQALQLKPVSLYQNYPNPFNPETQIAFSIKNSSNVQLNIYNVKGQRVTTLINEKMQAGKHIRVWNGLNESNEPVTSGVYFYELKTDEHREIRKMLLLK